MQALAFEGECRDGTPSVADSTVLVTDRRSFWRDVLALALSSAWPSMSFRSVDAFSAEQPFEKSAFAAAILLGRVGLAADDTLKNDLQIFTAANPTTPVLVMTDIVEAADVAAAMRAGAKGYLASDIALEVLIQSLRLLLVGGTTFPAVDPAGGRLGNVESRATVQPDEIIGQSSINQLRLFTPKELEVLNALGDGKPNKIIAYELGICETTVKVHMRHIMSKLGAKNRTHAALLAIEVLERPTSSLPDYPR